MPSLAEQDHRRLGGQQPVPPPLVVDRVRGQPEAAVHDLVHPPGQPAADRAGHHQRADDAAQGGQHEQPSGHGGYHAGGHRHHHGSSSPHARPVLARCLVPPD